MKKSGSIGHAPKSSTYYQGSVHDKIVDDFSSYNATQVVQIRAIEGELSSINCSSDARLRDKGKVVDDFSSVSTNKLEEF